MQLRFSTGIWVFGAGIERFAPMGYKSAKPIVDLIKDASKVDGLTGLEFHYPTEVNEENVKDVKNTLSVYNFKAVGIAPVLSQEAQWAKGALSALNENTRRKAIDRCKKAIDIARELGAEILIIWPGREGFDFPFTTNYVKLWNNYVSSIKEVAEYGSDIKIALEYKMEDPSSYLLHGSAGRALATILELRMLGIKNVGINVEFAHAKLAKEYVPETIVLISRYNALYHLHLNDIFFDADLDLFPASVHTLEFIELLYWLHEVGYSGWFGLDLFPRYIDAIEMVQQSIYNVKALYNALEKVGWAKIRNVIELNNPIEVQKLIREILGTKP
ncbi:sugar phosphate isomerase/epimerase family protein [Ignisphaera sp. 4213-co]|uniref:Sugar phosphate isomerase/epimerase family protein n=1 Tax=Ignisphaera cupida TaxID=3050454 RepID=A0ABD4Z592_9CREN|nr:sugar phosphate isomerase/epimerase family protein [Ignisphaera sp. 4213-co]MDK6028325.1 sugar phosphate isomerase/epimerase family protein [Ignisphaera sp. 4213-co]